MMPNPTIQPDESASTSALARAGRSIFPCRLLLGLGAVAAGALVIRPRNLFGSYEREGIAVSLFLTAAGLALRAWAAAHAGGHTRSGSIEAPRLATGGPYAHVRNPIYLGSIVLGFGMVGLLDDPWLLPLCAAIFALLYFAIIPAEEQFLQDTFRDEYRAFRAAVPRLIPRPLPWKQAKHRPANWRAARGELLMGLLLVAIYGAMRTVAHFRG